MTEKKEKTIQVPIEWHSPENLMSHYANNMVVQHTPHEFIVSFFETRPPLILGDIEKHAEQLKSVRSLCVARLIIAPERMGEFIKVLQTQYQDYLADKSDEEASQ